MLIEFFQSWHRWQSHHSEKQCKTPYAYDTLSGFHHCSLDLLLWLLNSTTRFELSATVYTVYIVLEQWLVTGATILRVALILLVTVYAGPPSPRLNLCLLTGCFLIALASFDRLSPQWSSNYPPWAAGPPKFIQEVCWPPQRYRFLLYNWVISLRSRCPYPRVFRWYCQGGIKRIPKWLDSLQNSFSKGFYTSSSWKHEVARLSPRFCSNPSCLGEWSLHRIVHKCSLISSSLHPLLQFSSGPL